jgi:capsid protein
MLTYLRRLQDERDSLTVSATSLADTAATEERDLTQTEQASLSSMQTRCAEIDAQLTTYGEQLDAQRAYAQLRNRLNTDQDQDTNLLPQRRQLQQRDVQQGSWGQLFVESDAFRNYGGRGTSGEVEVPSMFQTRAPIQIDTFPGNLPPYYFTPTPYVMTTPLLDSVGQVSTNSNSVEWYVWPGAYPPAQVVPEGGLKPEATFAPTPMSGALETYAHWKPISRQALADIPQIQSIVENALRSGILLALESAVASILVNDATMGVVNNVDILAGIREAIGTVQANGYASPNAILLNPVDYANLDVSIMGLTNNGPVPNTSVWGVRTIAVGFVPAGTAYVGDMKTAVTLFTRTTSAVYMTDSHADYFVRNLLVILAEQRALPALTESHAVVRVTTVGP